MKRTIATDEDDRPMSKQEKKYIKEMLAENKKIEAAHKALFLRIFRRSEAPPRAITIKFKDDTGKLCLLHVSKKERADIDLAARRVMRSRANWLLHHWRAGV